MQILCACASSYHVVAAILASNGGVPPPPGAPRPKIFYATDDLSTRANATAALGHLGDVVWSPNVTRFTHTASGSVKEALPSLVDWYMLGATDLVVGSNMSSYSITSADRRGVPLVICPSVRERAKEGQVG